MASPQLEDGYTPIANELLEAILCRNITAYQHSVLWAIIRKTYGYHKKIDRISLTQLQKLTQIDRRNLFRTLKQLKRLNMITSVSGDTSKTVKYAIQKDYNLWGMVSRVTLVSLRVASSVSTDVKTSVSTDTHKRKKK